MYILTVTGHRPNKLGSDLYNWDSELSEKYIQFFYNYINDLQKSINTKIICRSGMALGVDTMFAIAVLRLKNKNVPVELECCIPCANQSKMWSKKSIELYNLILKHCDKITFVSKLPYTPNCMQERNKYMVNGCDSVLAIWNGTPGGTSNCVSYAKSQNKKIDIVHPNQISN